MVLATSRPTTELAKAGGKLDGYNEAALEMRFGKYQRLHIYGTEPTPRAGHERMRIDGEVFQTLSTTLEGTGLNACLRARRMDRERFIESLCTVHEVPLAPGAIEQ